MSDNCATCTALRDNPKFLGSACPVCNAVFEGKLSQQEYELQAILDKSFVNTFPSNAFIANQLESYAHIKVIMYPTRMIDDKCGIAHFKLCTEKQFLKLFPAFKNVKLLDLMAPVAHSSHAGSDTYKMLTGKNMLVWFRCHTQSDWPSMNGASYHSNCIACPLMCAMNDFAMKKYGFVAGAVVEPVVEVAKKGNKSK